MEVNQAGKGTMPGSGKGPSVSTTQGSTSRDLARYGTLPARGLFDHAISLRRYINFIMREAVLPSLPPPSPHDRHVREAKKQLERKGPRRWRRWVRLRGLHHAHGGGWADPPPDDEEQAYRHDQVWHLVRLRGRVVHPFSRSIGGVIGTGLFLGTATSLQSGGPIGLLLGYLVVGSVCYSV